MTNQKRRARGPVHALHGRFPFFTIGNVDRKDNELPFSAGRDPGARWRQRTAAAGDGRVPAAAGRTLAGSLAASLATAWRFARVAVHFVWGWLQAVLVLPVVGPARRRSVVQRWCTQLLEMASVCVEATGPGPARPGMLVANHVSWLDMIALQSLCETRFVAKAEVRRWPLIGAIASRLGTVYVDRRSARSATNVARQLTALLKAGECVVLFPEGTTSDGSTVQPFQGSLLQAPIDARASVQPVAITYIEPDTGLRCRRASYCGDDGLLDSIWRTVSAPVTVRLAFGDPLPAAGQPRRALAVSLHSRVATLLGA